MQRDLHTFPLLSELFANNTDVLVFAENTSVARRAFFYEQLTRIDNAACSWLALLDGISLNIFRGFRTEEELVDYVLHEAYLDNVTVLASTLSHYLGTLSLSWGNLSVSLSVSVPRVS